MKKDVKLSVLITFCNQTDFIRDALDGIFCQSVNFQFEVLIGMDGVDVAGEKIIREYMQKHKNIKLFHVDNTARKIINIEKASFNRLNLIKNARGQYISLLDGDDFFTCPNRFQKMVDIMDAHPQLIGAFHELAVFDHVTRQFSPVKCIYDTDKILTARQYLAGPHRQFSTFIFRNIFRDKIPDDLNTDFVNDSTFVAYMVSHGDVYYTPQNMFGYRVNIPSIFSSRPRIIQHLYALLCGEINTKTVPQFEKLMCRRYKKSFRRVLRSYFRHGHEWIDNDEVKLIHQSATRQNTYFTKSILNYSNLSFAQRVRMWWRVLMFLMFNRYPKK